jgi:2C-methyl-D-erythritol 2,4-cyclodiphosphate synthase
VRGIAEDRVNVTGTTAKGLGTLGAGEGIATFAVASISRRRTTRKP